MKRGKYEAPRKSNPLATVFFVLLFACLILGTIVLLKFCAPADRNPGSDHQLNAPGQTQTTTPADTDPTTEPATEPTTETVDRKSVV